MARVIMHAVVSVDGFIARPGDGVGPLFDWYTGGDTELRAEPSGWTFQVSRASHAYVQAFWDRIDVTVIGRHLFDITNGWDGKPAAGERLVVVTHRPLPEEWLAAHPDAPFQTADSVEAGIALAKELAGDGLVCVTAGNVGGQAFAAGLVDEVAMDVAPVVFGEGVRYFGPHAGPVLLDDPDQVVQGDRVLHLHYTVTPARRASPTPGSPPA
jgi:dihydrofolate reductase